MVPNDEEFVPDPKQAKHDAEERRARSVAFWPDILEISAVLEELRYSDNYAARLRAAYASRVGR